MKHLTNKQLNNFLELEEAELDRLLGYVKDSADRDILLKRVYKTIGILQKELAARRLANEK